MSPRSTVPDCDYLLDRANAEIAAADRSPHARARDVHRRLAGLYLDRVFGDRVENGPALRPSPRERRRVLASPFKLLQPVDDPEPVRSFSDMLRALDGLAKDRAGRR